uniref:Helicase associated domain protein n=1 Tax=Agathobacter sp. TaxID=2021311 RepID=UPI0040579894
MDLNLFEHNRKAYEAACHLMDEEGKAAVIHPTGTGKSLIAFQLALDHADEEIVWLSPSVHIFRTQMENVLGILDGERAKTGAVHQVPADCSTHSGMFQNITFLTYAKLMHGREMLEALSPAYIILDEFHRCGAAEWGRSVGILLETFPKAKVLGLSATNIRYLDSQRDMAQEIFNGNVASELSLAEAVVKGILPVPSYVVSVYSYREELEKWEKRIKAVKNSAKRKELGRVAEQLRRALEKADGLETVFARHMPEKNGKYMVFCADKEHMARMRALSMGWFSLVDRHPHIYEAAHDNPETARMLEAFKNDGSTHLKLLFCIDMFNEGIHVADVDGVILLRPTVSPILYLQQIGRGLSGGNKKNPVIFDIVNNFDALYSIDSLKAEVGEAFSRIPYGERRHMEFQGCFRIHDEVRECRALFRQLKQGLSATWEQYYLEACSYRNTHGSLDIPKSHVTESGLTLGTWLMTQRRIHAGKAVGNLTEQQEQALEAIGMEWESGPDRSFRRGYAALKKYKEIYGDANVKAAYVTEDGYALGKWVSNLRSRWSRGETQLHQGQTNGKKLLTLQQIGQLDELGMIWDKNRYQWEVNFAEAEKFYKDNGNLDIPQDFKTPDGICLGTWVNNQKNIRAGKKTGAAPLTESQAQRLEGIGIVWRKER